MTEILDIHSNTENNDTHHIWKHTYGTRGQESHTKAHITRETHALFIWCVCTYTRAQQSCSARLLEWLGLPDLHSSRHVYRQRGDEISLAIALSLSVPYPVFFSVPALFITYWTHTHTNWLSRRNDYDFLAWISSRCRWNWHYIWWFRWEHCLCIFCLSFDAYGRSSNHLLLFKYVNKIFTSWKILVWSEDLWIGLGW